MNKINKLLVLVDDDYQTVELRNYLDDFKNVKDYSIYNYNDYSGDYWLDTLFIIITKRIGVVNDVKNHSNIVTINENDIKNDELYNILLDIIKPFEFNQLKSGIKNDENKLRWSLLPIKQVETVVKVLQKGSIKYSDDNWQKVDNFENRYYDAMMRHLTSWKNGERLDPETKLPHLAHAICNGLFLMWFDDNKKVNK